MKRADVKELHYIAPIENLLSIERLGILSNEGVRGIDHISIANQEVVTRREMRKLPSGRRMTSYVNLYFNARNPMLSATREHKAVVLRIDPGVLDLPDVRITDGNAAATGTNLLSPNERGFAQIDATVLFASSWLHDDPREQRERSRIRCAEVLIPDIVERKYIQGAYVPNKQTFQLVLELKCAIMPTIAEHLFFS